MRQTDFNLKEIIDLLSEDCEESGYPGCMLVNEIGTIFHEKNDEESENSLLTLINDKEPAYRAISFCYLYTGKGMLEKHHALFAEFRLKPENQQLLEEIDEMISRFRS